MPTGNLELGEKEYGHERNGEKEKENTEKAEIKER